MIRSANQLGSKNYGTILPKEHQPSAQDVQFMQLQPGLQVQAVHSSGQINSVFTFFHQNTEPGFISPGETRPLYCLTYVEQGTLHSIADGQELLLEQGDLVVYGPGQWYVQYADIPVAPRLSTVFFAMNGSGPDALLNRRFRASAHVKGLLQQMCSEQEQPDSVSNDMTVGLLNMVLLHLRREAASGGTAPQALHPENAIILHAQQYVSAHVRQKLSVPLLARKVDVSPSYLTALFHKHLHISPGEYIRRFKLQESKQMIRENTMNFTQIAAALQYSTVHHFSRQFKEKYGITPSEYAKSLH